MICDCTRIFEACPVAWVKSFSKGYSSRENKIHPFNVYNKMILPIPWLLWVLSSSVGSAGSTVTLVPVCLMNCCRLTCLSSLVSSSSSCCMSFSETAWESDSLGNMKALPAVWNRHQQYYVKSPSPLSIFVIIQEDQNTSGVLHWHGHDHTVFIMILFNQLTPPLIWLFSYMQ